jgi:hypothetical protein
LPSVAAADYGRRAGLRRDREQQPGLAHGVASNSFSAARAVAHHPSDSSIAALKPGFSAKALTIPVIVLVDS